MDRLPASPPQQPQKYNQLVLHNASAPNSIKKNLALTPSLVQVAESLTGKSFSQYALDSTAQHNTSTLTLATVVLLEAKMKSDPVRDQAKQLLFKWADFGTHESWANMPKLLSLFDPQDRHHFFAVFCAKTIDKVHLVPVETITKNLSLALLLEKRESIHHSFSNDTRHYSHEEFIRDLPKTSWIESRAYYGRKYTHYAHTLLAYYSVIQGLVQNEKETEALTVLKHLQDNSKDENADCSLFAREQCKQIVDILFTKGIAGLEKLANFYYLQKEDLIPTIDPDGEILVRLSQLFTNLYQDNRGL